MQIFYNKLVRDNIPEIIAKSGKKVTFRALKDAELKKALHRKLIEEAEELINAKTAEEAIEELADICEVICAIYPNKEISDLITAMLKKEKEKGVFEHGFFLESVEE